MPTRQDLQRGAARRLNRMFAGQRREIIAAAGSPPDPRNVPASLWADHQRQTEDELRALLLLLFIGMVVTTRIKTNNAEAAANLYAASRSAEIAGRIVDNSRDRILRHLSDLGQREAARDKVEQALQRVLGPSRAEGIAVTETTSAQSAAREGAATEKAEREGTFLAVLWQLRPCNHCRFCPMLNGMPQEFYRQFILAPPAHVHCCCEIVWRTYDNQDKRDAFVQSRLDIAPSVSAVREAAEESGVFLTG